MGLSGESTPAANLPASLRIASATSRFTSPQPGRAPLHVAAVLPADLEERAGDLPERADPHGVHQHLEHVPVLDHRLAQPAELERRLRGVPRVELVQALELRPLLLLGRPRELD